MLQLVGGVIAETAGSRQNSSHAGGAQSYTLSYPLDSTIEDTPEEAEPMKLRLLLMMALTDRINRPELSQA